MRENNSPEIRFKGFTDAWVQRKLGELYRTYSGQTPLRSDVTNFKNPTTPWIKTTDLNNGKILCNDEDISDKGAKGLKLLPSNTVLIAMYGGFNQIGRTGLLTYPATINQALTALEPNVTINAYFLITQLNHRVNDWKTFAASSRKDPNITKKDVEDFNLHHPTLFEQEKIGNFFRTLDDTITLHQRKLDVLKKLKAGYLQLMFPQAGKRVPRVRFARFNGQWEARKLGEVAEVIMGQSPDSANYTNNPNDHVLVQGNADMKNGLVIPRVWTTQVTKKADMGDIIFSVRAPVGDVGRTGYNVVLGRGVAGIRGNEFIYQTLVKMKLFGYWERIIQGSTFESINSGDLRDSIIPIPDESEQTAIGNFFKNFDEQIAAQTSKLEQLKQFKAAYLQKMFI